MMQGFYRVFYSNTVNQVWRFIFYPFRKILPISLKVPVRGIVDIPLLNDRLIIESNESSHLSKFLYWNGCEAFEYSKRFFPLIQKVNCFLDVGANFGYYSLAAAKLNPNCKIIAFEPGNGPSHFLKRNIKLNKLEANVRAEKLAVSDRKQVLEFTEYYHPKYAYLDLQMSALGNLGTKEVNQPAHKYKVDCITLDDYCKEHALSPELIKIDTEGNETAVFAGAQRIISTHRPMMLVEVLKDYCEEVVEELSKSHGYGIFDITGNDLTKIESFATLNHKRKMDVLLIPNEKADQILSIIR